MIELRIVAGVWYAFTVATLYLRPIDKAQATLTMVGCIVVYMFAKIRTDGNED
jgi:hypothetical protein